MVVGKMAKEKKYDSKEEIFIIKSVEMHEVKCDCCGRVHNTSKGKHIINGSFICNECGENCNPREKQCSITKLTREFKFS